MNEMKKYLAALLLAAALPAAAQTDDEATAQNGYTKAWVKVVAAPESADLGNSVRLSSTLWRASRELTNQTFVVADGFAKVVIGAKQVAQRNNGYKFAYWYLDDGDGEFDIDKDTQVAESNPDAAVTVTPDDAASGSGNLIYTLYFDATELGIYATEAEAKAAPDWESPITLFAYFSDGDFVSTSTGLTNFGTVAIDKVVNHPGDEITLTATPADGYVFDYWKDAASGTTIVSTENPYTTTSQGATTYYAVFSEANAPTIDFPAEGGFKVIAMTSTDDKYWVADEAAGLTVFQFNETDLVEGEDGRLLLNTDDNAAKFYTLNRQQSEYWSGTMPNFVYGRGRVKLSYSQSYGTGREGGANLILYASKNETFPLTSVFATDKVADATVYLWNEEVQAFLRYGDTHSGTVVVPAGSAYMLVRGSSPATQLAVGTTADAYDQGVSYLQQTETLTVGDGGAATYVTQHAIDLSQAKDIKGYRATVTDEGVTFSQASLVAAGTPLLLQSVSGSAATEAVSVIAGARAYANSLKLPNDNADGQRYVLTDGNGGTAFYPAQSGQWGEVFLDLPTGVEALYVTLDGRLVTELPHQETQLANLAELKAQTADGDVRVTLKEALVTYTATGTDSNINYDYAVLEDATGAILLKDTGLSQLLKAGQLLTGDLQLTFSSVNGITANEYTAASVKALTTAETELKPTEVTADNAAAYRQDYSWRLAKFTAVYQEANGAATLTVAALDETLAVSDLFGSVSEWPVSGATVDVTGYIYHDTDRNANLVQPLMVELLQLPATVVDGLAALKHFDEEGDVRLKLQDARITYANAGHDDVFDNDYDYVVLEDESAAFALNDTGLGRLLKTGQTVSGELALTVAHFYGMTYVTANDDTEATAAALTVADGEAEPLLLTDDNIEDYAMDYDWRLVKMTDVIYTPSDDEGVTLTIDLLGNTLPIQDAFRAIAKWPEAKATVDVIGYIYHYDALNTDLVQPLSIEVKLIDNVATLRSQPLDDEPLYNLSGQRVAAPYKGIVVKAGRKVVVR